MGGEDARGDSRVTLLRESARSRPGDAGTGPCPFDAALEGRARWLELTDRRRFPLAVSRWCDLADQDDQWLLARCHGPTLDLGCGPGRLVEALTTRGVPALGIDVSVRAVSRCRTRGLPVLRRDAFTVLPNEGHWRHVLLADGNIGIGGSPPALLRRVIRMLEPGGTVLLETERHGTGLWCGGARLRGPHDAVSAWFPWAVVGADAVAGLAVAAGLRVTRTYDRNRRHFAELARSPS